MTLLPSLILRPRRPATPTLHALMPHRINGSRADQWLPCPLVEGVRPCAPPGQEAGEADRLEHLGSGVEADCIERPLLDEDVADVAGSAGGHEDEGAQVGGALV